MKSRILAAFALQIDIRKIDTSNQDPPPSPIKTMSVLTWELPSTFVYLKPSVYKLTNQFVDRCPKRIAAVSPLLL